MITLVPSYLIESCVFPMLDVWDLGRLTITRAVRRQVSRYTRRQDIRVLFPLAYNDVRMDVSGYQAMKLAFDLLYAARPRTLRACIDFLNFHRVFAHDRSYYFIPAEPSDVMVTVYQPGMKVYDSDDEWETESDSRWDTS